MSVATRSQSAPGRYAIWRAAQHAGLVATAALLAGLAATPAPALNLLWNAIVPILPAVFLVNVAIWRNVCTLGTLTMLPGGRLGGRTI